MITVCGEALIDLIVAPDGTVVAVPGGGPYNTARTIGRLGLPVAFVGGLSTDGFGRRLREGLRRDGVDDSLATTTDDPTTLALAELDPAGVAAYRFYLERTSAAALDLEAPKALTGRNVTAVHVGTLGLVVEPVATTLERVVAAAPEGAVVMLDPNCRPAATRDRAAYTARIDRVLGRADVVKVSTDDLAFLRPTMDAVDAVADLLRRGPKAVLWTDGAGAVRVVSPTGTTSIAPPRVEVVDTVGAGDAFGGGFLAAWMASGRGRLESASHDEVLAAARHAVRVASFTCTRAGAEPPTSAELAAWAVAG